jgi:hypothetical protein
LGASTTSFQNLADLEDSKSGGLAVAPLPGTEKGAQEVHVKTIRALWRGVAAARAHQFEDAVKWFDIADTCAVWRGRHARWNLDAVLRSIIPTSRGYSVEPTLEAVWELMLLLSKAQPGHSRVLFDGLWKRWCVRACKSGTPWEYQSAAT